MTFIIGFVMLSCGVALLRLASPRGGKQPALMTREAVQFSVMFLVIVLVLGGMGTLIGSALTLIAF